MPPRDCMICSGAPEAARPRRPAVEVGEIALDHRLHVGVERGDQVRSYSRKAGIDLRRQRDESVGWRSAMISRARRSCVVEEREQEADGDRCVLPRAARRPRCDGGLVERHAALAGRARRAREPRCRQPAGCEEAGVSGSSAESYMWCRICRPISSTSRKPAVVIKPMRAPLRSSTALVATVVPWTKRAIVPGAGPNATSMRSSAASTARQDRWGARDLGDREPARRGGTRRR